jgi:uncharacterized protein
MVKQLWINLPVKDVQRSKEFFSQIGFQFNDQHCSGDDSACMMVGDPAIVVMLFKDSTFQQFARQPLADTSVGTEVMFSIDAESREDVESLAQQVVDAGGTLFSIPQDIQGWMYGCGFTDLDGHRWNSLYMDKAKMPKPVAELREAVS